MKRRINKNKLFFSILAFLLIINLLFIFDLNYFYIRAIFSFIFLITIPGLLIMLMLKARKINPWEYFVYVIGLSIAFLMFAGLAVNWILPLFGIDKPLSLYPILTSFNFLLLAFWFIAYKRNKKISLEIKSIKLDWTNRIFFIIPIIFPVLSILGALILNNNGPNTLTMIMLGGIAVYVFMSVLFRKKFNPNIYPWAILMVSLSLLLAISLRGWYVSGHDILPEYQMFQLTKENFHWSMSNFPGHAYNACLSITILPTIFSWFLKINDEYVFKLIFPIIFGFVPVGIYLFLKKYTKNVFAFIATFFFISQPTFLTDFPMMLRQEIALLFFTLSLLILFNNKINPTLKKSLFLIFGFSMVVSHYTTAYVALGLFVFTYFVCFIFRRTEAKKPFSKIYKKPNLKEKWKKLSERKYHLSIILVLLLLVFTFLWYAQLTETSGNLVDFTYKSIKNMGKIFTEEVRVEQSSPFQQFNIFYKQKDLTSLLQDYTKEVTLEYKNKPYVNLYPSEKYEDFKPKVTYSRVLPLKTSPDIASKIYLFQEIIKKSVKIFIMVGVFYLLFFQLKKQEIDSEYIIMALGGLFLLAAMMILPFASIEYNLFRTYQQVLVILSLPAILGSLIIFKFLRKEHIKIVLILVIFTLYFLFYSGFIPQIIGGSRASMQLNNFGNYYDLYYTHGMEIKSIRWLSSNYDKKNMVYGGWYTKRKLFAFAKINMWVLDNVLPQNIDKGAYVYSGYTNTIRRRAYIFFKGKEIGYTFPTKFLNKNKNLIYNNGGSQIFK